MKKIVGLFCLLMASFLPIFTYAETFPKVFDYITDYADLIPDQEQSALNKLLQEYDKKTSNQIVVITIGQPEGALYDTSLGIFRQNKIGTKLLNNGLLLTITDEKKIRITVGYGLEGAIPDTLASQIIENNIRPYINSGDIVQGITNFIQESTQYIDKEQKDMNIIKKGIIMSIIGTGLHQLHSTTNIDRETFISCLLFTLLFQGSFIVISYKEVKQIKHSTTKEKNTNKNRLILLYILIFFLSMVGISNLYFLISSVLGNITISNPQLKTICILSIIISVLFFYLSNLKNITIGGSKNGKGFSGGGSGFSGGGGSSGGGGAGN